jgi:hypothetical protein
MALDLTSPNIIPAEFNDRLSEQLLLQPDFEYFWARSAYSAMLANGMADMEGFDLAMLQLREGRLPAGAGASANLAEAMANGMGGPLMLSMGMTYPDLVVMVKEARLPGEVIKINRPGYINGDTTPANRQASNTTKLFGTNSQPITMEQVAITIVEYLGPTNAGGTLAPISLPRFTMHRSAHDLLVDVGLQLRRDRYRFLDAKVQNDIIAAATAAGYVTRPVGMSANSDYTGAGNEPFSFDLLVSAHEQMVGRKIPGLNGSFTYPALLDTHAFAQLELDPQYQRLARYEPQYNPLFPGYQKTVNNIVVCVSNNIPRLSSFGAFSGTGYQSIVFAPRAYGWASAQDAMALRNRNDDGGRNNEWGWTAYEGLQVLDDRFFQLIITD